jgi:hypothetical protein
VGEVARVAGYTAGADRKIKPEILDRIRWDIWGLARVQVWGADGPYDKSRGLYPTGWIRPLLFLRKDQIEPPTVQHPPLFHAFNVTLGYQWAHQYTSYDVLQVPRGFLELREDGPIRLGWFYVTAFRHRMTKDTPGVRRQITRLYADAGLTPPTIKHLGQFLARLECWHEELEERGVIGAYMRTPPVGTTRTPMDVYRIGAYEVQPPAAVQGAYREQSRRVRRGRRAGSERRADAQPPRIGAVS